MPKTMRRVQTKSLDKKCCGPIRLAGLYFSDINDGRPIPNEIRSFCFTVRRPPATLAECLLYMHMESSQETTTLLERTARTAVEMYIQFLIRSHFPSESNIDLDDFQVFLLGTEDDDFKLTYDFNDDSSQAQYSHMMGPKD